MNKIKSIRNVVLCIVLLSSCVNDSNTKKKFPSKVESNKLATGEFDSSIKVYAAGDRKYIILDDTMKFRLPDNVDISDTNIYAGVYELKDDSIVKHKFLTLKSMTFVTTFEDLGFGIRSRLYVYDMANKSLIRDTLFNRDYLYSSAGIFLIEAGSGKIFVVGKPEWYDAKQENILPASLCDVKRGMFKYEKEVYKLGSDIPDSKELISYFKNSMSIHGNGVLELPDNWSKNK